MQNDRQKKPPTWRQKSKLSTVLLLIVAALLYFFFPEEETLPSREGLVPVEYVKTIDGDTIWVNYEGEERKVRYLLIDTPEMGRKGEEDEPFAKEAKLRNEEILKSGQLELEFDVGDREDKYDRLLAYLYIDGESVQEKLIEEGLARVGYIYEPNTKYVDIFKEAERKAKDQKENIWRVEGYVTNRGFNPAVFAK